LQRYFNKSKNKKENMETKGAPATAESLAARWSTYRLSSTTSAELLNKSTPWSTLLTLPWLTNP
jgi:hypothetical protein